MTAQAEPGGPIDAASAWTDAILERGSLAVAWPLTHPDLRELLAATWVAENRDEHPLLAGDEDPEAVVEELTSLRPQRLKLWQSFDLTLVLYYREMLANVDLEGWGWAADPHPLAVDVEGVLLVDAGPLDENHQPLEPGPYPGVAFLMHYIERSWLVNGVDAPEDLLPDRSE